MAHFVLKIHDVPLCWKCIMLPSRLKKIVFSRCHAMIKQIVGGGDMKKSTLKMLYHKYKVKRKN
jgi:hypothetical protein